MHRDKRAHLDGVIYDTVLYIHGMRQRSVETFYRVAYRGGLPANMIEHRNSFAAVAVMMLSDLCSASENLPRQNLEEVKRSWFPEEDKRSWFPEDYKRSSYPLFHKRYVAKRSWFPEDYKRSSCLYFILCSSSLSSLTRRSRDVARIVLDVSSGRAGGGRAETIFHGRLGRLAEQEKIKKASPRRELLHYTCAVRAMQPTPSSLLLLPILGRSRKRVPQTSLHNTSRTCCTLAAGTCRRRGKKIERRLQCIVRLVSSRQNTRERGYNESVVYAKRKRIAIDYRISCCYCGGGGDGIESSADAAAAAVTYPIPARHDFGVCSRRNNVFTEIFIQRVDSSQLRFPNYLKNIIMLRRTAE
ncbi:unnamed protein product [Trichogramma brassicae]|uniref:Uncharacterized protein n=1 Tax=Trichogramma brassicae TaxID=86971 RepID=A0A6H5IL52_9HYME|nr:unnamed protein product [Trichogramma brassicae]